MERGELDDLMAFALVAEEASFTRAAVRLRTSQSALSHIVRRLEQRLGLRLLARTTRRVAPTEAGERLLETLRPALADIEARLAALSRLRDHPAGTVRITAAHHAATAVVWPRLREVLAAHPDLHLEISVDAGLTDIVAERFDAGVRLGEQLAQDMVAVRISPRMRMAAFAAPAYLTRFGRPQAPQDLARHNCINIRFPTLGGFYVWEFERDRRELRVRVNGQLAFNSVPLLIDAAAQGLGIGFCLEDEVRPWLDEGRLVRLLEDWTPPFQGYYLYYPSRRELSPAMRLVIETLRWRG